MSALVVVTVIMSIPGILLMINNWPPFTQPPMSLTTNDVLIYCIYFYVGLSLTMLFIFSTHKKSIKKIH
ncbi:hypothetical protein [Shouchella miscanthi]|uniref:Uncharacterized protein n=1 Tax=Shouchella miscanthi TaxID=2598861 RepID=A0ABU6NJM0_9BACI|nr:hypothetical protein [Shouchella miscanthi]MED4128403.1 hypothetical protein [Shouchella miscanthi]